MHGEGTDTQTDRQTAKQTDGHRDSMTESAQWADSVKIRRSKTKENLVSWPLGTDLDYERKNSWNDSSAWTFLYLNNLLVKLCYLDVFLKSGPTSPL